MPLANEPKLKLGAFQAIMAEFELLATIMRRIPISYPFSNRSRQTTPYKISVVAYD